MTTASEKKLMDMQDEILCVLDSGCHPKPKNPTYVKNWGIHADHNADDAAIVRDCGKLRELINMENAIDPVRKRQIIDENRQLAKAFGVTGDDIH